MEVETLQNTGILPAASEQVPLDQTSNSSNDKPLSQNLTIECGVDVKDLQQAQSDENIVKDDDQRSVRSIKRKAEHDLSDEEGPGKKVKTETTNTESHTPIKYDADAIDGSKKTLSPFQGKEFEDTEVFTSIKINISQAAESANFTPEDLMADQDQEGKDEPSSPKEGEEKKKRGRSKKSSKKGKGGGRKASSKKTKEKKDKQEGDGDADDEEAKEDPNKEKIEEEKGTDNDKKEEGSTELNGESGDGKTNKESVIERRVSLRIKNKKEIKANQEKEEDEEEEEEDITVIQSKKKKEKKEKKDKKEKKASKPKKSKQVKDQDQDDKKDSAQKQEETIKQETSAVVKSSEQTSGGYQQKTLKFDTKKPQPPKQQNEVSEKKEELIVQEKEASNKESEKKEEKGDESKEKQTKKREKSQKQKEDKGEGKEPKKRNKTPKSKENKETAKKTKSDKSSSNQGNTGKNLSIENILKAKVEQQKAKQKDELLIQLKRQQMETLSQKLGFVEKDTPKKILKATPVADKGCIFLMEWEKRGNGEQPQNSHVMSHELKNSQALFLLDYYEDIIRKSAQNGKNLLENVQAKPNEDAIETEVVPEQLGSFSLNDKPKEILEVKSFGENSAEFLVSWHARADNTQPSSSVVSSETLKSQNPQLLISFYESKIIAKSDLILPASKIETGNQSPQTETSLNEMGKDLSDEPSLNKVSA